MCHFAALTPITIRLGGWRLRVVSIGWPSVSWFGWPSASRGAREKGSVGFASLSEKGKRCGRLGPPHHSRILSGSR